MCVLSTNFIQMRDVHMYVSSYNVSLTYVPVGRKGEEGGGGKPINNCALSIIYYAILLFKELHSYVKHVKERKWKEGMPAFRK